MWQSQTNTGQENMSRSRQAVTDRATMDPPLTSAQTLWSASQGQVGMWIFMAHFGDCLFMEEPGRVLLFSLSLRQDHTAQMRLMNRLQCFLRVINPYKAADDL